MLNTNKEIWKAIEGYSNYMVSSFGIVKSIERTIIDKNGVEYKKREKVLKQNINDKGYKLSYIYDANVKRKTISTHRLVAKAFISNPKKLKTVNHINGIKTDNRVENLEWLSNTDNMRHAYDNGIRANKHMLGNKNNKVNYDLSIINKIKKMIKDKNTGVSIAEKFKISTSLVSIIKRNKHWSQNG